MLIEGMLFASYRRDLQPMLRGKFIKKVKSKMADELRPEYKRTDFGEIVCGKYANRIKAETNVGYSLSLILHRLFQMMKQ